MKTYRKVLIAILVAFGCAMLVALPFGVKILREEGMEGVFKRKRAFFNEVAPEATPALDEAEKATRKMGLR